MKVEVVDELSFILYLNNKYLDNVDFSNKQEIELYLKKIFTKLKQKFDNDISGFFEITIYINKDYGAVFVINKEDLDYYEYFSKGIEMQVNIISNSKFLYKVDDIFIDDLYKKCDVYIYNNNYYIDIKDMNDITIFEYTNIVYGDIVNTIFDYGKKININV